MSGIEPSSETTAPFYPFTLLSLSMPVSLFIINLVFLALATILYLVQVLLGLSTRTSASVSLANHRLVIDVVLPSVITFP